MESQEDLIISVIDLSMARTGNLDESYMTAMGAQLGYALEKMLAGVPLDCFLKIRGNPAEIQSLLAAMGAEKHHLEALMKHGYDSPATSSTSQAVLRAIQNFEKMTVLPWPIR